VAEELGERTEEPTPRRLREARSRGQVPKSQDLASAIDLAGALLVLLALGGFLASGLGSTVAAVLDGSAAGAPLHGPDLGASVAWAAARAGFIAAPVLLVVFLVAFLAHFVQVGPLLTTKPLRPRLERLSPAAGLKRIFGPRGFAKTLVNSVKLVAAIVVAALVIRRHTRTIPGLPALEVGGAITAILRMALELALWLLALLVVIGLIDLLYQRWQHRRDLRMTRQEVKDERRSMEGDPKVRERQQRMARQIALQRVRSAVPGADVVVTNPSHFAVALKYDAALMSAPRVVAKGADELAFRIREIALTHRVPLVERPPLARALYWGVEVGREVRPEHYEAVAEVLAFVYRLEGSAAQRA
jgi:flagellar biosynthetic protein FlhB